MELEVVLKGALPPILAALLLVSLGGARWLAVAAALGLWVAFALLKSVPDSPVALWSSPNGTQWLLWMVIGAACLSTLEHFRLWRGRLATITAVVLAALGTWLVLQKLAARWSAGEVLLQIGLGWVVVAVVVLATRRALAGRRGPWPAVVAAAVLSVDAGLLAGFGGSALLGQLCGAVAAAVGAGVGTALWRKGFALGAADGTWLGLAHGLFLLGGVHLASLPWWAGLAAAVMVVPFARR